MLDLVILNYKTPFAVATNHTFYCKSRCLALFGALVIFSSVYYCNCSSIRQWSSHHNSTCTTSTQLTTNIKNI